MTERARRLWALALAVPAVVAAAGAALSLALGSDIPFAVATLLVVASVPGAPWLVCAANRALAPVQRRINGRFESAARAKLARIAPRVIGITGSYGKTTTKVCIGAVLEEAFSTLITPASFNSQLGVIRTINEHLTERHRGFVVEMGMYRAGDIAELCELVHPEIGVLTAIGPAHLERMGTIEAIADAKAELALALPADGHLVDQRRRPALSRDRRSRHRRHRPVRREEPRRPRAGRGRRDGRGGDPLRAGHRRAADRGLGPGCSAATTSPTCSPRPRSGTCAE